MPPETIDDVIRALGEIIDWAWQQKSRTGYFAALYRRVTQAVKDGVSHGRFQNGPLMERLDVVFANRYLQAFEEFRSGQKTTLSWQVAFQAASQWYPLVVQQLLGGMNAHINLDLGVAAAACSPGDQIAGLQADFNEINAVLAGEVGAVEKEIAKVSPWIGLLEKLGLREETKIINFSLTKARDCAWSEAVKMAALPASQLPAAISDLDLRVQLLGRLVVAPPLFIKLRLFPIRIVENNDVRQVLDVLAGKTPNAATDVV
jgi:hypothetical protein